MTEEKSKGDTTIKNILILNHPAFSAIKKAANIKHRVIFSTIKELDALLASRGYHEDENCKDSEYREWDNYNLERTIKVKNSIFDKKGYLKVIEPKDWKDNYVGTYGTPTEDYDPFEEEIPF